MLKSYDWKALLLFALLWVWLVLVTRSVFPQCTVNGTARDLTLPWDPSTTQYFNTVFFVGYFLTQIPGGYLSARFSSSRSVFCRMSMYVLCYWVGKNNVMFLSTQGVWPFCSDQRLTDDSPILCDEVCQDSSVHHTFSSGSVWGAFEFYKEILNGFVQNAKSLTLLLHVYLFQGMAIPALNGVLSAWSLTSEKSRMVTLTYCGKSRAWIIRHNRRKDKPSFISTSYKSDKFESAPTFFSISINRSIFETNSQINSKMLPVLDLYLERLKKK